MVRLLLGLVIFKVFSNLSNSMTLWVQDHLLNRLGIQGHLTGGIHSACMYAYVCVHGGLRFSNWSEACMPRYWEYQYSVPITGQIV